ncbi:putative Ig domain-containing protein, partial [Pseudanabaenaceae cyanobacterium LEGE 13415]|nr:putative Ig domain-containing protein [Pseudanabaenaceae cyanobacterium LEGE 13415]
VSDSNAPLFLPETGTYRLVIDGTGDVKGAYSFKLLDVAKMSALELDTPINGSLNPGQETDFFRFRGTSGQPLYFDLRETQWINGANWVVYGPHNQLVASSVSWNPDIEFTPSVDGEYVLAIRGNSSTLVNYSFQVSSGTRNVRAITLGSSVSGTLAKPGQQDIYEFSGEIGSLIFLDVRTGTSSFRTRLIDPAGREVQAFSGSSLSTDKLAVLLTNAGKYQLVIDGDNNTIGDYSFRLLDRNQATKLTSSSSVTGQINPGNSVELYQLSGEPGQRLRFDLAANAWNNASWILYDPNGAVLRSPNASSPDFTVTLASQGTYTLAIVGSGNMPLSYSFNIANLSVAPIADSGFNTVQSGTLNAGQTIDHTFTATAGTLVLLDSLDNTATWQVRARLRNPDGTFAFSDHQLTTDRGPILLEQTGTYTLQVFGWVSSTTGSYRFNLIELPKQLEPASSSTLELGSVTTSTLNPQQSRVYAFDAEQGQRIFFNAMVGQSIGATLYDPNGNVLFTSSDLRSSEDRGPQTLSQNGLHYLVLHNNSATTQNFAFEVIDLANARELADGIRQTGALLNGQQAQTFRLQAAAGERLFFDVLVPNAFTSVDARWRLYDSSNNLLIDRELRSDDEFVVPVTGEYHLVILGGATATQIDYSFRMVRYSSIVGRDTITPGIGEATANSTDALARFPVRLSVQDSRGATTVQDFQVRLWADPDHTNPIITSKPKLRFGLADQIYQYQLETTDPDGDPLTYRLLDGPTGATINSDTGELLWFPDATIKAGDRVTFIVEVSDRRGGKDVQSFSVDVFARLGRIQGAVFADLNQNGYKDSTLIAGDNPHVVFAIDVSGSTGGRYVDWRTADLRTITNTDYAILDMELATVLALSEQLIQQGRGNSTQIGLVLWNTSSYLVDMDPSQPGTQLYTTALADRNNNGITDLREALNTASSGGGTDFNPGLQAAKGVLSSLVGDANLIFMSDGFGSVDPAIVSEVYEAGINVTAFGIGAGAGMGQIKQVDPDALQITKIDDLISVFSGWDDRYSPEPFLKDIPVYLDLNNNGMLDPTEPWQLTRENVSSSLFSSELAPKYSYIFEDLLPGTYTIRQLIPSGYVQTAPNSGGFVETITVNGDSRLTQLFGLHKVSDPPNQAPVFRSTPPASPQLRVGQEFNYQAIAQDPDDEPLQFDLPLAPQGMLIDAKTGQLFWNPTDKQIGRFNVIVRVQDGRGGIALQAFEGEVKPSNQAPVFTTTLSSEIQPQVGKSFRYQAQALDPDNDALTYTLVAGSPTWVSVTSSGLVSATPPSIGIHEFTLRVSDGKGGEALQTVRFAVNPAALNQAPIVRSQPRTVTRLGSSYTYAIDAIDPDGDSLTYRLDAASVSKGMKIEDGILTWIPAANQSGLHRVQISVSDGRSTTTQSYDLNVVSQATNRSPVITSAPNGVTNLEQVYTYSLDGSDPDFDALVWSLDQYPEGMVIDPITGALRWQPNSKQIGEHRVVVRLIDASGLYTTQEFTLKVTGTNTPPMILSVPVTRAAQNQAYSYTVVASDPENNVLSFSLGRRPSGMTIDTKTGTLSWTPTQTGSYTVDVQVTDAQGATTTQTFEIVVGTTVINQAPRITSAPVFLANPQTAYRYEVKADDPDGNPLIYRLLQAPSGMTISATGVISWNQPLIGTYQVVVGVEDGSTGAAQGYTLTVRENRAPEIRSVAPTTVTANTAYRYDVQAIDLDGDSLTYRLDEASISRGMTIDDRGRIAWTPKASDLNAAYPITITVTDAQGAVTTQAFTLTAQSDTDKPRVNLIATQNLVERGSSVTLIATATDNTAIANLGLVVNGQAVMLDANGRATLTFNDAGVINAIATATDLAGNSNSANTTIDVIDLSAPFNPNLAIDLPDVVTAPVEFNVGGDGVVGYKVEAISLADGTTRTLAEKRGAIALDEQVTFNPTLLENGAYTVRVTFDGANGSSTSVEDTVSVEGELKLGNFRLSFTDLVVPVSGIPITLTRTYDSLTADRSTDFGYGWRMEFRDTRLTTSLGPDKLYQEYGIRSNAFERSTKVYITLPGGKREAFQFAPIGDPVNQFIRSGTDTTKFYIPAFRALNGSTNTLQVRLRGTDELPSGLNRTKWFNEGPDGKFREVGTPFDPANPFFGLEYVLTTKDGTAYIIDPTTGTLTEVRDPNGNRITYTDNAITSSTGQKVTFERDAQGRIVSVTDPMGEVVRYTYDASGDLTSVTDREENVTRMIYDTSYDDPDFAGTDDPGRTKRSHFLREIIDPLGRVGARSEYGEDGRLKQIVDANGKAVEMTYALDQDTQIVTDQLGNRTVYVYDDRGNVLTEIDAEGKVTQRKYDANNWVTEETIVSDRSDDNPNDDIVIGFTTRYEYDAKGNKLSEESGIVTRRDRQGNLISETRLGLKTYSTYGDKGRLLSETDALERTMLNRYDAYGNLTQTEDALKQTSSYVYESNGLLKGLTDANGKTTSFTYDLRGNVTQVRDALGFTTDYTYNDRGDKLTEMRYRRKADGTIETLLTTWTYDTEGRVKTMTDAENNRTVYGYDKLGRQVWVLDARGYLTESKYNTKGELEASLASDGTLYSYNAATDALVVVQGGTGTRRQTTYTYDDAGRKIAETDALNRTTRYVYDKVGRLIQVILPDATPNNWDDNPSTRTEYYSDGLVKAQIDERGNRTEFRYDSAGRQVEIIYADSTPNDLSNNPRTRYEYDRAGQQSAVIDALDRRTEYQYDDLGRLKKTIFADNTFVETEYDKLGRRTASIDQNGKRTGYCQMWCTRELSRIFFLI